MPAWLIWLLAAGVLAIAEALSLDLVLLMLAIAALATAGALRTQAAWMVVRTDGRAHAVRENRL